MANPEHVEVLARGIEAWNTWRHDHMDELPDLSGVEITDQDLTGIDMHSAILQGAVLSNVNFTAADFRGADLSDSDFSDSDLDQANLARADLRRAAFARATLDDAVLNGCDLRECDFDETGLINVSMIGADLSGVNLAGRGLSGALLPNANLSGADLRGAICVEAVLSNSNLTDARLQGADLDRAELTGANLTNADLRGADLSHASIVGATVEGANLTGARIHALATADLSGSPRAQNDLIITPRGQAAITTDDLDVAQFVGLAYASQKIQSIFSPLAARTALILGAFSSKERSKDLEILRAALRALQITPITLNLDGAPDFDYGQAAKVLTGLSLFAIVDVTLAHPHGIDWRAITFASKIPYLPIVDSRLAANGSTGLLTPHGEAHWILPPLPFGSGEDLGGQIRAAIADQVLAKHNQLRMELAGDEHDLTIEDLLGSSKP